MQYDFLSHTHFFPPIQITKRLGIPTNGKSGDNGSSGATASNAIRNSKLNADLSVLDQLVSSLLERQKQSSPASNNRESTRLSRLKSLSFRNRRSSNKGTPSTANELNLFSGGNNGFSQTATAMPTILESSSSNVMALQPQPQQSTSTMSSSSLDRAHGSSGVRQIINTIKNAPHRLSQGISIDHHRLNDEEGSNLTRNMLD